MDVVPIDTEVRVTVYDVPGKRLIRIYTIGSGDDQGAALVGAMLHSNEFAKLLLNAANVYMNMRLDSNT